MRVMMILQAFSIQRLHAEHLVQNVFGIRHFRELATNAAVKRGSNEKAHKEDKPGLHKRKESNSFGLDKKQRRLLRTKLIEVNEKTKDKHPYRQLYPWKTKLELAEDLKKSEVYNQDGLIALCKPYGIAQAKIEGKGQNGQQTIVQTLNSGGVPVNAPVLRDVLPILQNMYKVNHLEIVKATERWTSGLLLLSTEPKMTEKVQKCIRRSKAMNDPPLKYWAVTNGLPNPSVKEDKVAISLEYVNEIGKVPVIKKKYTNASIERQESRLAKVRHLTLMSNEVTGASLVEVNLQVVKWHFLKVWLTHCYAPVLGDTVYGGRIKTLLGKKIQISPQNITAYQPQEISEKVYEQLQLPEKTPEVIPSLIHLAEIKLCQFNKDKSDLVLKAHPPEHFMWTCTRLGLSDPSETESEEDE